MVGVVVVAAGATKAKLPVPKTVPNVILVPDTAIGARLLKEKPESPDSVIVEVLAKLAKPPPGNCSGRSVVALLIDRALAVVVKAVGAAKVSILPAATVPIPEVLRPALVTWVLVYKVEGAAVVIST
jgi:hypothetical protein